MTSGVLRVFLLKAVAWGAPVKTIIGQDSCIWHTHLTHINNQPPSLCVFTIYIWIWITCCQAYYGSWAIKIGCEKFCFDKPQLITHTFHPLKCPYSTNLAIFWLPSDVVISVNFPFVCMVMCVFLQFLLKQCLERPQRRYVWVRCLLDNTLEVKINVCQTKWNVRLQPIHDRWGLVWYFLRWMKTGTQAALSVVVKQSSNRKILKDSTSDFPDFFYYWLTWCRHVWEPLFNRKGWGSFKSDCTAD